MVSGIIGGILGVAIAYVLDLVGVDTYVIELVQPYLTFTFNLYHFYGLCGLLGAIAGVLPW